MVIGVLGDAGSHVAAAAAALLPSGASPLVADAATFEGGRLDALIICGAARAPSTGLRAEAAVVDLDERRGKRPVFRRCAHVVTYGYNSRACVTVSGCGDGVMIVCVQRNVTALSGALIPPQEFSARIGGLDERAALAVIASAIVCDIESDEFRCVRNIQEAADAV